MIAAVWARVQGWLAFDGAALAALGTAYLAGRSDGRDSRHAEGAREGQSKRRAGDEAARESDVSSLMSTIMST